MVDTVTQPGPLNDATLDVAIIKLTGNLPVWLHDAYRRFIMMFSDIVLSEGVSGAPEEQLRAHLRRTEGGSQPLAGYRR